MWIRQLPSKWRLYGSVFLGTIIVDQVTKDAGKAVSVINSGVSFQWLANQVWLLPVLFFLWGVGWWFTARKVSVPWWSHAIFWGAALSNIFDRWWFGGVRDIWVIPGTSLMNNAADWLIAGIGVYWVWYLYRQEKHA